jgi:crotonobetainyl-CoA:carnitine CoA-transferase CaiB-like acyl-CoA transferase
MISNLLQRKTYDAVSAALPFPIDVSRITVEHGVSYARSPIKAHDYATGIMAVWGSVVDHLGQLRGLPSQTMVLNRRLSGLLLNSGQMHFINGCTTVIDTWPVGADNGLYRAKDGRYVWIVGLYPHLRDGLLEYFQCATSRHAIQAAVEKKTAQEIEDELAALHLPAGMMRSPEEWLQHPQGKISAAESMVVIEHTGQQHKRKLGKARCRPLERVRVLELTHLVAGPTIGRLLAEQGAEVIKVQPPTGDWVLPLWLDVSWGKKNISLDVKSVRGKARFSDLLSEADVLVSSLRPGALARLGLDNDSLRAINPNLVVANAAYPAKSGPWKDRRGFEQIAQSVSGLIHIHSKDLAEPTLLSVLINDYLTGYLGAIGVVAALAEREEKGGLWDVTASLTRCAMMAAELVEPMDAEPYAPASLQDLLDFAVDQETPYGTFTRLGPAVAFSHSPSMFLLPTAFPATSADTTGWTSGSLADVFFQLPHVPSRFAKEGRIRHLFEGYGIEDRGDGGGGFSLASPSLLKYMMEQRGKA